MKSGNEGVTTFHPLVRTSEAKLGGQGINKRLERVKF